MEKSKTGFIARLRSRPIGQRILFFLVYAILCHFFIAGAIPTTFIGGNLSPLQASYFGTASATAVLVGIFIFFPILNNTEKT